MEPLSPLVDRFLRYCRLDTQADPKSVTVPSTEKQKDLGRMLLSELKAMGFPDAAMDEFGYVTARLPGKAGWAAEASTATAGHTGATRLALFAHMDTSPDAPGEGVTPVIHPAWDGSVIPLPGDPTMTIDPARNPALLAHVGEDLITSDGRTLLGSDDKAGVAIMMQLAAEWATLPGPLPDTTLCFTIDEEIGRGVDHLDIAALGADVGYSLDGSGVDSINFETFNAAAARVDIHGVAVHPGYAKGVMVNALRVLAELIHLLPADEAPETTQDREGYLHPHTVGSAGADRASLQIIIRDFTLEGLEARKQLIRSAVATLASRHPKARIELQIADNYKNMRSYIEEADPRAVSFAVAAGAEMGITLRSELIRGGTDGARLSEMGLPTPNVFNGGHDYHSCFEWNTVQSLERAHRYVQQLLSYWARHG
ncbi:MAG: tripeptide aminopeptidase [Rhodothermales bacterium]|jgi:tripeptide aminopeptidase